MADEVTRTQESQNRGGNNRDTDSLLEGLVTLAETTGAEIPLTLDVKGTVITGRLISRKTYFIELAELFRQSGSISDEAGKAFADTFANALEEGVKEFPNWSDLDEKDEEEYSPKFILLKEASRVYPNTVFPAGVGGLWRGRVSSVDGFSFGMIK